MIPNRRSIALLRRHLLNWFKENARDYPWRRTSDPWKLLVAEMMLQRTKSEQVVPVYKDFLRRFKKPQDVVRADSQILRRVLWPLGLRWRIALFRLMARKLVNEFGGRVPSTRDQLLSLPGVGNYVAGAVLSFAFNRNEWIVDSNIVRVFKRVFGVATGNEGRRDQAIVEIARYYCNSPKPREANLALIDFASIVCVPKNPRCSICFLRERCYFFLRKRPPTDPRHKRE